MAPSRAPAAGTASTSPSPTSPEVAALRHAGVSFRNDVATGPGGAQILLEEPAGNVIELFQPAGTLAGRTAGGSDDTADTDDHEQDEQEDQR
jgi:hypothetical protein